MTLYELISINSPMLKKMHENGIRISDYKYLNLYEKYVEMVGNGDKISYIVSNLATLYDEGERTIYRLVELFETTAII